MKNDDINIPPEANAPPKNVVRCKPIASVNTPDTGDTKNVVPIVNEPTSAEIMIINVNLFAIQNVEENR